MRIDLTGKQAIVTGGGSGIGASVVVNLLSAGAEVYSLDLPAVDVADRQSLENAFARFPGPDIVIANAGTAVMHSLTDTPTAEWQRLLDVNLSGVFHTIQLAARRMKARRTGTIVITASTNSYDGEPGLTAYNATKAGLLGLLHTAAAELGPYGIRVNAVCPGLIRTPLTKASFENPGILKDYFRHIPMGRGGEAHEVASAVVFLASDLASYVTGAALLVDGGQMASKFGTWTEDDAEFMGDRWVLR